MKEVEEKMARTWEQLTDREREYYEKMRKRYPKRYRAVELWVFSDKDERRELTAQTSFKAPPPHDYLGSHDSEYYDDGDR